MKKNIIYLLLMLFVLACESEPKTNDVKENIPEKSKAPEKWKADNFNFPYQLNQPNETFKLPKKLAEISGLSISKDGQFLLAVNDEQGKLFFINKKTGEVEKDEKGAKNGDFEGVERVGDYIYMVESKGDIHQIGGDEETIFKTPLKSSNNVEGLGYDQQNHRLLLACKDKAEIAKHKFKRKRAIYAFDLKTEKLIEEPVLLIDRDTIQAYLQQQERLVDGVLKVIAPEQVSDAFSPSGIAQHPLTGDFYIIASVGKLLLVVQPSGQIRYIEELDTKYHKQPEGICFDKDGTLYMSTEGRGGKGKIYRFDVKK